MTVYNVSSASQLSTVLAKSQNGDVIQLAPGSYGKIAIGNVNISGNVTITSADPNNQAVINGLMVKGSSGLTFSNLDFHNIVEGSHNVFQVLLSKNIVLDHLNIHGPANMGSGLESALMMVRASTNVTVSNSEFYNGWHGLSMLDNNGMTVSGNYLHDIRTDGVRGGGNSNLLITKNTFTDFRPALLDHPDAIQLWTNNTNTSATNITISDNMVVRGQGGSMQGVFMRDITGNLPFQNVSITGNIILGGRPNGIAVEHVGSGLIDSNVVAGFVGERSWIRYDNSTNLMISNNVSTFYASLAKNVLGINGNVMIPEISDGGAALATKWLSSHTGFSSDWGSDLGLLTDLGLVYDASLIGTPPPTTSTPTSSPGTTTPPPTTPTTTASDDTYYVRSSSDVVTEGVNQGTDTVHASISYTLGANVENLVLTTGGLKGTGNSLDNVMTGSTGNDTFDGMEGNDQINAGAGDDVVFGAKGNDTIYGGMGNDKLYGNANDDKLYGEAGNDVLKGDAGNDLLVGGAGADTMTGGSGNDVFAFYKTDFAAGVADRITDFAIGQDKIDLSTVDLGGAHFAFIGTSSFHKVAGELRYQVQNGSAYVSGDIDGDGKADFSIKLDKVSKLAATDFVL